MPCPRAKSCRAFLAAPPPLPSLSLPPHFFCLPCVFLLSRSSLPLLPSPCQGSGTLFCAQSLNDILNDICIHAGRRSQRNPRYREDHLADLAPQTTSYQLHHLPEEAAKADEDRKTARAKKELKQSAPTRDIVREPEGAEADHIPQACREF